MIVGLIAIIIVLKKCFDAVGNAFECLSQSISNDMISRTYSKRNISLQHRKTVEEKINTIKGDGTDQEYTDKVQNEINDLLSETGLK